MEITGLMGAGVINLKITTEDTEEHRGKFLAFSSVILCVLSG